MPDSTTYDDLVKENERLRRVLSAWIDAATSGHYFGRMRTESTPDRLRQAIAQAVEDKETLNQIELDQHPGFARLDWE